MEEKDFDLRLAQLRTKKNVSQREMSLAIGQNQNYINHIESCQGMPSLAGIIYICEYLGITISEFFDFEASNPAKLHSIIELLKKLDDEQLSSIETIIKGLIK